MKVRAPQLVHNVADGMVHWYALIIQGILLYENTPLNNQPQVFFSMMT
jgi:hypothetical protein